MLATRTSEPAISPRILLRVSQRALWADRAFGSAMLLCAMSLFVIVLLIVSALAINSRLSMQQSGWSFITRNAWNPVTGSFGALPFLFGTVASSFLALVLAAPPAIAAAIFVVEICPLWLRASVSFLT